MIDLNIFNVTTLSRLWVQTPDDECSTKWVEFTFETQPFEGHYKEEISELEHTCKLTIFINTIEDQRTLLTQLQQLCAEELDKFNKKELASATPTEES